MSNNDNSSAPAGDEAPDKKIQVWTSVSYDWINFETRSSPFLAEIDPELAAIKFQKLLNTPSPLLFLKAQSENGWNVKHKNCLKISSNWQK